MMIHLASSFSYAEVDDVKDCTTTKKIWNKLAHIFKEKIVLRDKVESFRGKFDDMGMMKEKLLHSIVVESKRL